MNSKYFTVFALVFVVATVFVTRTESTPLPSDIEENANMVEGMDAPMKPSSEGNRQGRFYGYGWPGFGYGGLGYNSGSSAAAAAAASSSSTGSGIGFPYGRK